MTNDRIRYFVEYDTFQPGYGGTTTQRLIANAWGDWLAANRRFVDEVSDKTEANVIVTRGAAVNLSDVARADSVTGINVEADSSWSAELFERTVYREIVRLFGLG